jgi:hypothetical protein
LGNLVSEEDEAEDEFEGMNFFGRFDEKRTTTPYSHTSTVL